MNNKHTPGPWITGQASWNEEGDVRYTLEGIKEAKVDDCLLIAAAPEMLEALENLENDDGSAMPPSAWKLVQNAIKKAKGE